MLPGDLPILFPPSFGVSLWSFFAPCWGSQSPSKRKSAKKPEVSSVKTHGDHLCVFQRFVTWFVGMKPGSWTAARIEHPNLHSPFIDLKWLRCHFDLQGLSTKWIDVLTGFERISDCPNWWCTEEIPASSPADVWTKIFVGSIPHPKIVTTRNITFSKSQTKPEFATVPG